MKKLIEKHRGEIEKIIGRFEITNDDFYGLPTITTGGDEFSYEERYAIGTDLEYKKALERYLDGFASECLPYFIYEEYLEFFDIVKWKESKHSNRGEAFPNTDNSELKIGVFYLYILDC